MHLSERNVEQKNSPPEQVLLCPEEFRLSNLVNFMRHSNSFHIMFERMKLLFYNKFFKHMTSK